MNVGEEKKINEKDLKTISKLNDLKDKDFS